MLTTISSYRWVVYAIPDIYYLTITLYYSHVVMINDLKLASKRLDEHQRGETNISL